MAQATRKAPAVPMTLRPLHDRVVIERLADGDERQGRIIIPDSAKEKPQQGTVIAVGTGKVTESGTTLPLDVKAGDRVLFAKYSGSEIEVEGREYLIMKEEDLLGVVGS